MEVGRSSSDMDAVGGELGAATELASRRPPREQDRELRLTRRLVVFVIPEEHADLERDRIERLSRTCSPRSAARIST
jgi:hypothetical protein